MGSEDLRAAGQRPDEHGGGARSPAPFDKSP
jgi:hypothetical protein